MNIAIALHANLAPFLVLEKSMDKLKLALCVL